MAPLVAPCAAGVWALKTDHWFYGLFQSAPDLITLLLPAEVVDLGPDDLGDALYRFEAPELKAVNHRFVGVLWPRGGERGTPEHPVVLLEVQMHSKVAFHHRLAAQSFRSLQQHPEVLHMAVVVVLPHRRLRLGPAQLPHQLQEFLAGVYWLSLEELGHQSGLHPLISHLTLPVLSKAELRPAAQQILQPRPDLLDTVVTILVERFPHLTLEEIIALINLLTDHLLHTRAEQDLIQKGEARGRAAEAAAVALRQLNRRCGPQNEAVIARIQALPLEQLEILTDALLDFNGPDDLTAWLASHAG